MRKRLLLRHADVLATMNDAVDEIRDGALLIDDQRIVWLGASDALDPRVAEGAEAIDARGCVVVPGLVNCHHHLFQTLTRAIGTGRGLRLFDWLKFLYPIWAELTPEAVYFSAKVGLIELVQSGCTAVADHLYLYPNGARIDDEIRAAAEVGVRFHPTRGSMSLGASRGGLPPDRLCEAEDAILADSVRAIEAFHDPAPLSMLRVGLAPCSPFSVTAALMRESAHLARAHPHVRLHTHLAETRDEDRYCLQMYGKRPLEYAESVEWTGPDVWFAHMVHPDDAEITRLANTRSGVCHCPSSNMILASGIAPVRAMLDRGVRVGLGVDGSAGNDGSHLLGEARQAMLLQRVGWPGFESRADRFSAREALRLATRGGAQVLGRDDIGMLAPGMAADVVAFRVDDLSHAGARGDAVAALVTCAPAHAWLTVIDGRVVVRERIYLGAELPPLVEHHNALAREMLERAGVRSG